MIVGMDFGTTNSGMSVFDGRTLQLIPLDRASANPRVARTALYITNRRRAYIGREAIDHYYAQNINRKVKYERVWVGEITLTFAELPEFVRDVTVDKDVLSPGRLFLSFKTGLKSSGYLGTLVGAQFYLLEDIVALYLYATRRRAEDTLQTDLKRIVLGRPVRFSTDPQQDRLAEQRLIHAAFQAGYEEVYLQYEPIAAAYFYETSLDHPQNVLIFDFGGGTLDLTIARLGAPGKRDILATGGVPIAGDLFDQKLVRSVLPRHFGEGSHYRGDNGLRLPVPAHFFEAFADWQEMLSLNRPDRLRLLERIERTAADRRRIRMLIDLIKSSASLTMFDAAEAAKRDLSERIITTLSLDGPGFSAREPITRDGFEQMIAEETRLITDLLDDVTRMAGLRDDQIDAVIRTGGSAQIPVFIRLLEQRFGPEKVRSIDTFSSVASGLGVIARYLEAGEIDLRGYRRDEWSYGATLRQHGRHSAPRVDLDLMKKFIDLEDQPGQDAGEPICVVAVTESNHTSAVTPPRGVFGSEDIPLTGIAPDDLRSGLVMVGAPQDQVVMMTSEYRFFRRSLQQLADLAAVNLTLAEMEGFFADAFGRETVSGLILWSDLSAAGRVMLIASSGQAKIMPADALLPQFEQTHPFQLERLPGVPVALVPADAGELALVTDAGSVARLQPGTLPTGAQRVMRLRKDERIVGALRLAAPADILLATASGHGKRLHTRALPFSNGADLGIKVLAGRDLCACAVAHPDGTLWAITTRRMRALDLDSIPLDDPTPPRKRALLRLDPGEALVALRDFS